MISIMTALGLTLKKLVFLVSYFRNKAFPEPLSKEEEHKYLKLKEEGDQEAAEKLVEHNLRLVAHVTKKFETRNEDNEDLISIGTVGLLKAVQSYSLDKGTKLSTYAARCIENEILMYFRKKKKSNKDVSINDPIGSDKEGNEISLMDILGTDSDLVHENVELNFDKAFIYKLLHNLDEREKEVIIYRFGLNNEKELTQKQLANKLKISRSYVSRIESRALSKLKMGFKKGKKRN